MFPDSLTYITSMFHNANIYIILFCLGVTARDVYFPKGQIWTSIWDNEDKVDAKTQGVTGKKHWIEETT